MYGLRKKAFSLALMPLLAGMLDWLACVHSYARRNKKARPRSAERPAWGPPSFDPVVQFLTLLVTTSFYVRMVAALLRWIAATDTTTVGTTAISCNATTENDLVAIGVTTATTIAATIRTRRIACGALFEESIPDRTLHTCFDSRKELYCSCA